MFQCFCCCIYCRCCCRCCCCYCCFFSFLVVVSHNAFSLLLIPMFMTYWFSMINFKHLYGICFVNVVKYFGKFFPICMFFFRFAFALRGVAEKSSANVDSHVFHFISFHSMLWKIAHTQTDVFSFRLRFFECVVFPLLSFCFVVFEFSHWNHISSSHL